MAKIKPLKNAHTSNSKVGMGDYYGTAIKQKVGRARDVMGITPMKASKLKKPPKSLA
jgi:hypothetical protein